ncbi:MAG: tRNA uridine(34) 5-carboxymethylaminomethyl modification radical SAM/GNAT enzyme Elp3, partial [Nanoarchaeota archaeon]|nr:tRNA uridine(34) 5-carboxymethylaminomethyl modification radical SAM/GNAT enzyme Elp3 [Nanoarchaeota archaeon]
SKSGIIPLTVVLPPKKCNHGTCIYCPGGDHVPQSYTDKSPAIMRAMALHYDIREQVKIRFGNLIGMGHPVDKVEVIIIGGTFTQYEKQFKYDYVKGIFDILNGENSKTLEEAKTKNETAKHRIVALCIENRPDNCSEEEVKEMLSYGCTRVEIGVQMLDDYLYEKTNRGHTIQTVVDATKRLRDAGFKIGYHIMPGLPYSSIENDKEKFKLVFSDSRFRPDQLKIYPCQVVKSSPLAEIHEKIGYHQYGNKQIRDFVKWMMREIPDYCRVMRMMREIPAEKMVQGDVASTSMRGDIMDELREEGGIKEIRLREIGLQKGEIDLNVSLKTIEYDASEGKELFLEMVNKDDILFGLLRLRFTSRAFIEELKGAAIVRELHVYGQALALGSKRSTVNSQQSTVESQHIGMGKDLIKRAEELSKAAGYKKIAIISGVGVREYYRKLGYSLQGEYMIKSLL